MPLEDPNAMRNLKEKLKGPFLDLADNKRENSSEHLIKNTKLHKNVKT